MRERLLIFHPTIAPYRIDLFNDLNDSFDTRICLEYWNLRDQTFDYDKIYSQFLFKPIYLKELLKIGSRSLYSGYWKHLDEFQPDIVLVSEYNHSVLIILLHKLLKRKRYKIVSICDDSYNMVAENNDFSKLHRIARRMIVPCLDDLILVEPKVTDWYIKKYGKGFCFPIIKPDEKTRKEYEKVIQLSSEKLKEYKLADKNVFLFVGRLVALKNVETAICAFSRLNQEENVFVVVGDGHERSRLENLSRELNANVIFTGRLEGDALNVWYNIAHVFVLASYQEAFGAVTNEALLAGCYALISNKAGSACLIEEGENGYTFSPMDIDDLANKMQSLSELSKSTDKQVLKPNKMLISYKNRISSLVEHLKGI